MDPRPVGVDKPGTGKEMYIGMYCVKVKDGVYRYAGYSWKSGMPSNIVREFDTDTNGKLLIIGLPVGKYQMREKTAPEGYQIAEQWKKWNEIPLNATDIPSGTKTITVADPPATYIFQFLKVSEADKTKPVPNAKYHCWTARVRRSSLPKPVRSISTAPAAQLPSLSRTRTADSS